MSDLAGEPSILVSLDGSTFWTSVPSGPGCSVTEYTIEGTRLRHAQAACGVLRHTPDGVLAVSPKASPGSLLPIASFEPATSTLVDQVGTSRLERAGDTVTWWFEGGSLPIPHDVDRVRLLKDGQSVAGIRTTGDGETLVRMDRDGSVHDLIAEPGLAIDSFDLEPAGRDAVLSAGKPGEEFDVALAALEGGNFKWLPRETGHEHSVSWAPRGNKVTWFVDGPMGTVMRTLHIPTGYQLSVPFTGSRVRAHTWDPAAERVFALVESAGHDLATVAVKYGGEDRRFLVEPRVRLSREADFIPGVEGPSLVYAPEQIAYGRKYPATIVLTEEGVDTWSPVVYELALDPLRGIVRISSAARLDDPEFRQELLKLAWIDPAAVDFLIMESDGSRSSRSVVLLD